ncbi:Sec-independent protein translocase TatB [Microbacterium sp. T2.11-28]|uniref:Sec-independent protein translocase TatB n=1 Tax=unclassified Microbacterium TaxID=2609290 RepID=UPI0024778180|nr:Sec-independent protein translocase TatB [Microbacterium sp. T2.11-28]CAI9386673.1 Sec-independent protein translocase protein TatB [Microbacterium sp. T2.11-28]
MFFGIDMEKIVIILVVAALLLGPEKLPRYAELLAKFTVRARDWLNGARSRVKDEMGEDFDDIEWRKLDPRQYDPRRIIRDALLDDTPSPPSRASAIAPAVVAAPAVAPSPTGTLADSDPRPGRDPDAPVPFDSEAT